MQIDLCTKQGHYPVGAYTRPKHLGEKVAAPLHDKNGVNLTQMTPEQGIYPNLATARPFKPERYRC